MFSIFFRISVRLCCLKFHLHHLLKQFVRWRYDCTYRKIWWCVWFIRKSFISRNKFLFKKYKRVLLNHFKVVSKSNKYHTTLPSILYNICFKYFPCHSCFSRYLHAPDKPHILYIKILISKIYILRIYFLLCSHVTIWKQFFVYWIRFTIIPIIIRIIWSTFKSNIQEASYSKAGRWKSRQTWTKWGRDDRITMKGIPVHTSSRIIHIYPTYGFSSPSFLSIPLENVHCKKVFLLSVIFRNRSRNSSTNESHVNY